MPKNKRQKFTRQENEMKRKYGPKRSKLDDDIGTLILTSPSLSSYYSLTSEDTHVRMSGIDNSLAATLTQNSKNQGQIRVVECPTLFEENSESSEIMKNFQINNISDKLQQISEKHRTISGNYESIVSIKRSDERHMKEINYDPLRSYNTDSLHYGLAHTMKPEALNRKKIKSEEQLDALENISLKSDLTKKFGEFSVNLLGKLSSINSVEIKNSPCDSSTDSTMHHCISKSLFSNEDKKASQLNSNNGEKILTHENSNPHSTHEKILDTKLGGTHLLIEEIENSLESEIKIEPVEVIMSEDVVKSEDSYSSYHQEETSKVSAIRDENTSELHSTESIKDDKKKQIKSINYKTKYKQTKSILSKKTVTTNPKPIKQVFIFNNSENLLTETVDKVESDNETADNLNNQIPETTSKICSSTQNKFVGEDNFNEIKCDSTTTQISNQQVDQIFVFNEEPKVVTSSRNSDVISSSQINVCMLRKSDNSIGNNITVAVLKNSVTNNSDPKEKCNNISTLSETSSVSDNYVENMPCESNSHQFGNYILKENRVTKTSLFHGDVNEELPNKNVNVRIKPFGKQKDNSNIMLEIDRAMETLINLRQLLTVNIIKSDKI